MKNWTHYVFCMWTAILGGKEKIFEQSERYSQRTINNLYHCVIASISIFGPLPLSEFCFEANVTLTLPRGILFITSHSPKFQICRLGSHRNFACAKTPLFKPFQKWPNTLQVLHQNTISIVFLIWSSFLDTYTPLITVGVSFETKGISNEADA